MGFARVGGDGQRNANTIRQAASLGTTWPSFPRSATLRRLVTHGEAPISGRMN